MPSHLPVQIPASSVGRFTDVNQAKSHERAMAAKQDILRNGQFIAGLDNTSIDRNSEKGTVVAPDAWVGGRFFGDLSATFVPIETPAPPKRSAFMRFCIRAGYADEPAPPPVPHENFKSVHLSYGGARPQTRIMTPLEDGGKHFEYVNEHQKIVFNEDPHHNLTILVDESRPRFEIIRGPRPAPSGRAPRTMWQEVTAPNTMLGELMGWDRANR